MKHTKTKLIFACIMLIGMFSSRLAAQLNGIYTINSAVITGGSNYQTFTAFASAINAQGISGPVTVNVVLGSGPYVQQIDFVAISGTSATNTITINGNNTTLTFAGGTAANPHTMRLSGTDYLTVNNLNLAGTNATNAMVLHLWNGADHNRFNNCTFTAPITGTSARLIPVGMSGSNATSTTFGNSGSDNIWTGCTMTGGVRGVNLYANTGAPYNTDNQIIDCTINDFYQYGIYMTYGRYTVIRGNTIQRLVRNNTTTAYGMYLQAEAYPTVIEKNRIKRMFDGIPGSGSQGFGIRIGCAAPQASANVIRNNVIYDIYSNGTFYGIYDNGGSSNNNNIYHNTISLDDINSTVGGQTAGIISYSGQQEIRNNVVTIRRGGSGQKHCLYYGNSNIVSNNNILYYNPVGGFGGIGFYNADFGTLANWQLTGNGWDMQSASADPLYTNPATGNFMPTVAALNNIGLALGVATDITNVPRNLPAPDAGAFEFFNQACSGTPTTNSVIAPNGVICPSALSFLTLANTYTVNGISFQWQLSTNSAVGPFTAVSGATAAAYVTPTLGATVWYNAVLTCANGGVSYTTTAGQIQIATTVTNSVPYYEDFEGPNSAANLLPNCSWSRSSLPNCKTSQLIVNTSRAPNSGVGFAFFDYGGQSSQNNYRFHSNGIQLNAGVTYSAWVNYITPGWSAYSDISLKYGPSQSTLGLVTLTSMQFPQNSSYAVMSKTFQVNTSGIYYLAVTATDNFGGEYMSFDDLGIIAPCHFPNNAANFTVSGPASICMGQTVNIVASGAGTYSWSTGSTAASIPVSPLNNTTYTVLGSNPLSNCANTMSASLIVNTTPAVQIYSPKTTVCEGESLTLSALGSATSYTWSNGPGSAVSVVTPMSSTTYTVVGSNFYGCTTLASVLVNVIPTPQIGTLGSTNICLGEPGTLTATGANTYTWSAQTGYLQANPIAPYPTASTVFTLTGTDLDGCKGSTVVYMVVNACTGIANVNGTIENLSVYPNPNNGEFTVELHNGLLKTIEVTDVTGRTVSVSSSQNDQVKVNIRDLANGVYYVKIKSDNSADVFKVVKQ